MLYVIESNGNIYTERQLYLEIGVMRSSAPRAQDLIDWGVSELQPDVAPKTDIYIQLKTATQSPVDGLWYRDYSTRAFTAQELADYQESAIFRINTALETKVESLADKFPSYEKQTWDYQVQEASAWLSDNTVTTPFIDSIKLETETKAELCQSIIDKQAAYKTIAGYYVQLRREKRDAIRAATTRVDIDAIVSTIEAL